MTSPIDKLEQKRLELQQALDGQKSAAERNRLGQFATPTALACEILRYGVSLLPLGREIRFLDPAIGTGAFYSALRACSPNGRVAAATGFEVDPHYGLPASSLWRDSGLTVSLGDFTRQDADDRYNLIICNPPYVRHHHLKSVEKLRLGRRTARLSGMSLSGLAGLYCHFMGLAHPWMDGGAVAGWLIPSEFMDVNYGVALKHYLLEKVTLLHVHRFDPSEVQFADAIVSSAVVWIRNEAPLPGHSVKFTFGGSLMKPARTRIVAADDLRHESKWTRFPAAGVRPHSTDPVLGDFFEIKRGIATGDNSFFILSEGEAKRRRLPKRFLHPILPSPRYIMSDEIDADGQGNPVHEKRLYLLNARLSESEIKDRYAALWAYLEEGRERGVCEGYICRNRPIWYAQEQRPPAPIVCTYLGRPSKRNDRPFRFIRNRSRATVANVYLAMYPTEAFQSLLGRDANLIEDVWKMLNRIDLAAMLGEGRVYGGGLLKLEPKELGKVPVPEMTELAADVSRDVFVLTAD